MVRLRREIEGIRFDRAVASPPWCDDETATAALTPAFDDAICAHDAQRVLIAGVPRLDLATRLARSGRYVTVCDIPPERLAGVHRALAPDVAGRLQLVDKCYGVAAFSPSSFDLVTYFDTLAGYDEPVWVAHKLARELKVDGVLMARLWVRGALGALGEDVNVDSAGDSGRDDAGDQRAVTLGLRAWQRLEAEAARLGTRGHLAIGLLLDAAGADAFERGAWQASWRPRHDAQAQLDAIDSRLRIEQVGQIALTRPRLAALAARGRAPLRRAALRELARAPELGADALRSRDEARIVTLVARRALGDRRLMAGRLRT